MEVFYDPKATVTAEDFYAEDTSKEIEIAITFSELDADEKTLFAPYLEGDDLTVVRLFSLAKKAGTYHGSRLQNADFTVVRDAGGKREILAKYKEIREQPAYAALPVVKNAGRFA